MGIGDWDYKVAILVILGPKLTLLFHMFSDLRILYTLADFNLEFCLCCLFSFLHLLHFVITLMMISVIWVHVAGN